MKIKNLPKLTGKHLCWSLFLNKVAGLRSATLLNKRLQHRFFPVSFGKFLRTPFLQNTSKRLFLYHYDNSHRKLQFYFGCYLDREHKITKLSIDNT